MLEVLLNSWELILTWRIMCLPIILELEKLYNLWVRLWLRLTKMALGILHHWDGNVLSVVVLGIVDPQGLEGH